MLGLRVTSASTAAVDSQANSLSLGPVSSHKARSFAMVRHIPSAREAEAGRLLQV